MIWTTVICAILGPVLLVASVFLLDSYDWDGLGILFVLTGGLMVLAAILIPVVTYSSRSVGRTECSNWGHQTDRPTKFVILNSWDGGTCLTKDDNGKWVSKDNVQIFIKGK